MRAQRAHLDFIFSFFLVVLFLLCLLEQMASCLLLSLIATLDLLPLPSGPIVKSLPVLRWAHPSLYPCVAFTCFRLLR